MKDNVGGILGNAGAVIFTAIQSDRVLQIISLILTIISILISITFTIYKWWKTANEDGKITPEELEELKDKIDDINNDIKKK